MNNFTTRALIVLFGLFGSALIAANGCGKSGSTALTSDGAFSSETASDTGISGSGGGGAASGGASGTGGAGTGGADAKGSGGTPGGTGGNGTGGAATGGNGSGGNGLGGTGGNGTGGAATGGNGSGGNGLGGGITTGGSGGNATGGIGAPAGGRGGTGGTMLGTGGVRLDGGATGGTGGTIGVDGAAASGCPPVPPAKGDPCVQSDICYYEDCAGSGRALAFCSSGVWQVRTGACSTTTCQSFNPSVTIACPAGQICLAIYGKAPVCATQTCGTGAVTPGCVSGAEGNCNISESSSVTDGTSIRCCLSGGTSC
jgi:hypothetical protein